MNPPLLFIFADFLIAQKPTPRSIPAKTVTKTTTTRLPSAKEDSVLNQKLIEAQRAKFEKELEEKEHQLSIQRAKTISLAEQVKQLIEQLATSESIVSNLQHQQVMAGISGVVNSHGGNAAHTAEIAKLKQEIAALRAGQSSNVGQKRKHEDADCEDCERLTSQNRGLQTALWNKEDEVKELKKKLKAKN